MTSPASERNGRRRVLADMFASGQKFVAAGFGGAGSRPENVGEVDENLGMVDGAIRAESSNLITVKYISSPRRHLSLSRLPMGKLSPDK